MVLSPGGKTASRVTSYHRLAREGNTLPTCLEKAVWIHIHLELEQALGGDAAEPGVGEEALEIDLAAGPHQETPAMPAWTSAIGAGAGPSTSPPGRPAPAAPAPA